MHAFGPLGDKTVYVLGWVLLHSLWQGALVGCAYALLRSLMQGEHARYRVGLFALATMAVCPLLTAWQLWPVASFTVPISSLGGDVIAGRVQEIQAAAKITDVTVFLPWVVAFWFAGVALITGNSLRHWCRLGWLVREGVRELPRWQATLVGLSERFAISRPVRLLESMHVSTPTLIGTLKPVILLPISVVAGFAPQQIEMIIAHELAHVRRWDYLVNLFQVILETILFYHPVLHWISREVRDAREACCDDLVLEVTNGNPVDYARALASLEELQIGIAPALAANGGALLARIRRIVGRETASSGSFSHGSSGLLILLLLGAGIAVWPLANRPTLPLSFATTSTSVTSFTLPSISSIREVFSNLSIVPMAGLADPPKTAEIAQAMNQTPMAIITAPVNRIARLAPSSLALTRQPPNDVADISQSHPYVQLAEALAPTAATKPKLVKVVQPSYPASALRRGIEGRVVLSFAVTIDGVASDIQITDAEPLHVFEQAAKDALRQWRFTSPGADISSSEQRYTQTFEFSLRSQTPNSQDKTSSNSAELTESTSDCQQRLGSHICH